MTKSRLYALWPLGLFLIAFLGMAGCASVPVEVLSVAGPDSLLINQTGTFSASVNEKAKQPVEARWSFGDNTTAPGLMASHSFAQPGTYTVAFTATNRKGKSTDTDQTSVVVYVPPVPAEIVSISADQMNPDTRTTVRFSSNVRGDAPVTYRWNFGDGESSTGASPTHVFARAGSYTVQLTATNDAGTDMRSLTINVRPYEAAICREVTEMNAAFFERNASTLTEDARAALQDNLAILSECPNVTVRVDGYAAPGERNAQGLSEDRARAVEQYYVAGGVPTARISTIGRGRVTGVTSKKEGTAQYRRADSTPMR